MDIAQKLALDSPEDAEYIVAKVYAWLISIICANRYDEPLPWFVKEDID